MPQNLSIRNSDQAAAQRAEGGYAYPTVVEAIPTPAGKTAPKPMVADGRFLRRLLAFVVILAAFGVTSPLWARTPTEDRAMRLEQELNAYLLADDDTDGLPNGRELEVGTNATNADTDGDGLSDRFEVDHQLNPLDRSDARAFTAARQAESKKQ